MSSKGSSWLFPPLCAMLLCLAAQARVVTPFFPTRDTTKTLVAFSWDSAPTDYDYWLQVEDTTTSQMVFSNYVHQSGWPVQLYPGNFQWRVEVLSDASTHEGFGSWTPFRVLSSSPSGMEDLLGVSPLATSPASLASLSFPTFSWQAADGSVLMTDTGHSVIKRLSGGLVTVIAGNGLQGYNGDGLATAVELNNPTAAVADASGNIYIFDAGNRLVRKLTPDGQLTTVAGVAQHSGAINPDKTLVNAEIGYVPSVAIHNGVMYVPMNFIQRWNGSSDFVEVASVFTFDGSTFQPYAPLVGQDFTSINGFDTAAGTDWVTDGGSNGVLRKFVGGVEAYRSRALDYPGGVLAIDPNTAYVGDGGIILKLDALGTTVVNTRLVHISGIEAYADGRLLVTDSDDPRVMAIAPDTGDTTDFVNGGTLPFASVTNVVALGPHTLGVLTSNPGGLFTFDTETGATIRLAGLGINASPTPGPANLSGLYFPSGLAADSHGNMYWTESEAIYEYQADTGQLVLYAGKPYVAGDSDNIDALDATFHSPVGVAVDSNDNLLVADTGNNAVRLIDHTSGMVTTIATVHTPMGLATYPQGVYVTSYLDNDIQFCFYQSAAGSGCSVAAGVSDPQGGQGEGQYLEGWRLQARFSSPNGVALIDGQPDLVVADQFNNRIRRVNSTTTTLVGSATFGYGPNSLNLPTSAVLLDGKLYIADTGNGLLRMIPMP